LVADIERVGPNTLRVRDKEYSYTIGPTHPFYENSDEVRPDSLFMQDQLEPDKYEHHLYKNLGLLSSTTFFLNHEKDLHLYPPESFTYEVSE
jgi:hypothetical protein